MMKKVREEKSYRVVQIPATEYIEEVIRYVYECPNCVDENDRPVTKSAKEKRIIEKSPVTHVGGSRRRAQGSYLQFQMDSKRKERAFIP